MVGQHSAEFTPKINSYACNSIPSYYIRNPQNKNNEFRRPVKAQLFVAQILEGVGFTEWETCEYYSCPTKAVDRDMFTLPYYLYYIYPKPLYISFHSHP